MSKEPTPSSKTTLVILLGASTWPYANFPASEAYTNAANSFKNYLLDSNGYNLPESNLCNMFDTEEGPLIIDRNIRQFLARRLDEMEKAGYPAKDLLVYFVGHGYFAGSNLQYYLAIQSTSDENKTISGLSMEALVTTLNHKKVRRLRRIFILDCCFAAAAYAAFQAEGPEQVAIQQTVHILKEEKNITAQGTALLCSSGKQVPSLLARDKRLPLFTQALVHVLTMGDSKQPDKLYLSLRDLAVLTEEVLNTMPEEEAPRPEVHSPDQIYGDIANIPFFPNTANLTKTVKSSFLHKYAVYYLDNNMRHIQYILSRTNDLLDVAWSLNGEWIAMRVREDACIKIWNAHTEEIILSFPFLNLATSMASIAWSPDSMQVAVSSAHGVLYVWDMQGRSIFLKCNPYVHFGPLLWSADGNRLVSPGGNGKIDVWDTRTWHRIVTYPNKPYAENFCMAWSSDLTYIASVDRIGNVRIWDTQSGQDFQSYRSNFSSDIAKNVRITEIQWIDDDIHIIFILRSDIHIYNIKTKQEKIYVAHQAQAVTAKMSPNKKYIASSDIDGIVHIWDIYTLKKCSFFQFHPYDRYAGLFWSPDGTHIAVEAQREIQIWQIMEKEERQKTFSEKDIRQISLLSIPHPYIYEKYERIFHKFSRRSLMSIMFLLVLLLISLIYLYYSLHFASWFASLLGGLFGGLVPLSIIYSDTIGVIFIRHTNTHRNLLLSTSLSIINGIRRLKAKNLDRTSL